MDQKLLFTAVFNASRYFAAYLGLALILESQGVITLPLSKLGLGSLVVAFWVFVILMLVRLFYPPLRRANRKLRWRDLFLQ